MQNKKQIPESRRCEPTKYEYKKRRMLRYLKYYDHYANEFYYDIKLETYDNKILISHKVVLTSVSPYFYAMFTNFLENNRDLEAMRHIDSTALQLLVNFIYLGEIKVTEENAQVLLQAANLLQLEEVKGVTVTTLPHKVYRCKRNS